MHSLMITTHDSDVDYDSTLSIKGLGFDPL